MGRFDTPIRDKIVFTEGFARGSAHWDFYVRWRDAMEQKIWRGGAGEDPAAAANVIFEATTTEQPRLRWRVGADVEAAAQMRSRGEFEDFERGMRAALGLAQA